MHIKVHSSRWLHQPPFSGSLQFHGQWNIMQSAKERRHQWKQIITKRRDEENAITLLWRWKWEDIQNGGQSAGDNKEDCRKLTLLVLRHRRNGFPLLCSLDANTCGLDTQKQDNYSIVRCLRTLAVCMCRNRTLTTLLVVYLHVLFARAGTGHSQRCSLSTCTWSLDTQERHSTILSVYVHVRFS